MLSLFEKLRLFRMLNRHEKTAPHAPFVGIASVLACDLATFTPMTEGLSVPQLASIMSIHLGHVERAIDKYRGRVLQFAGGAVIAYWRTEDSSHAQRAYDAAREAIITLPRALRKLGQSYVLRAEIATGDMAGEFFGPTKQFQVVGRGRAILDRLGQVWVSRDSHIVFTQYTRELLRTSDSVEFLGELEREGLENLMVYTTHPVGK